MTNSPDAQPLRDLLAHCRATEQRNLRQRQRAELSRPTTKMARSIQQDQIAQADRARVKWETWGNALAALLERVGPTPSLFDGLQTNAIDPPFIGGLSKPLPRLVGPAGAGPHQGEPSDPVGRDHPGGAAMAAAAPIGGQAAGQTGGVAGHAAGAAPPGPGQPVVPAEPAGAGRGLAGGGDDPGIARAPWGPDNPEPVAPAAGDQAGDEGQEGGQAAAAATEDQGDAENPDPDNSEIWM